MHLLAWLQWLESTSISTAIREGEYWFPIIETVHVIALAFSAGIVMWVDLRLLGVFFKSTRISNLIGKLESWAIGGFAVMYMSGILLFIAEPIKCYTTLAFRIKVLCLILLSANVVHFHRGLASRLTEWDELGVIPWQGRCVGAISLSMLIIIIIMGRWTAYS